MKLRLFLVLFFLSCIIPALPAKAGEGITVTASWYDLEGKRMANGQIFCGKDSSIAACRTLPLGTRLVVKNPENGRELKVVVKDRGPFVKGRGLDLTIAGAEKLGFRKKGVAPVIIYIADSN